MARRVYYDPKFNQTALSAAMLGSTDKQLAEKIGISVRQLAYWKNKYPEFLAALKNGKDGADSNVVRSLYQRATGYDQKVTKLFVYKGKIVERDIIEHVAGDVTAQIYWLKNRQPVNWRDRPLHTDGDGDEPIKELLRAIRDSPSPAVNGANGAVNGVYHADPDIPVPAPS